jgi:hypothetical protein
MRTVSFQGTQISESQRRALAFQQQSRTAFLNPILAASVEKSLADTDRRKEQGIKPERQWFVERQEKGTSCFAEWMGY